MCCASRRSARLEIDPSARVTWLASPIAPHSRRRARINWRISRRAMPAASKAGRIFVGVGGWNFAPWRGSYYPKGLPHAEELHYSSRQLTSIEINSTFYRLQTPATFKKWHDDTPDGFVFSVKAPRFVTNRRLLGTAESSIEKFLTSGVLKLGDKLG